MEACFSFASQGRIFRRRRRKCIWIRIPMRSPLTRWGGGGKKKGRKERGGPGADLGPSRLPNRVNGGGGEREEV